MEISLSTGLYNDLKVEDAVAHLANIEWREIEFDVVHVANIAEENGGVRLNALRELCDRLDVTAWQMHCPEFGGYSRELIKGGRVDHQKHVDIGCRWVEYAKILNVHFAVFHPVFDNRSNTFELNVSAFKQIAEFADQLGVKVAIENVPKLSVERAAEIKEIIRTVRSSCLGICLDTSHINMRGLDVAEAILECGDLLWATHISDNDGSGDQHRIPYNARYQGKPIDWIRAMQALKTIEYDNAFNLELMGEGMSMVQSGDMWVPGNFAPLYVRDKKLEYARDIFLWLLKQ